MKFMAAFPMGVWLAFMIITSLADCGIGSVASVPSTVFIGKLLVYLLTYSKSMMILYSRKILPNEFQLSSSF